MRNVATGLDTGLFRISAFNRRIHKRTGVSIFAQKSVSPIGGGTELIPPAESSSQRDPFKHRNRMVAVAVNAAPRHGWILT